ncbi:methyltransferase domain-containing protein [Marinobacterium aestuariivivens]|uniref:Methyltransferase domain-containing protein n=1 Tax=Marinobacterium aestuariivivens TaxID=1698799 RepID=A0ABW1ZWS9_9GAMM
MNAALLDKHRIAESFSRAAVSYDDAAELQRQVGHRLLELIPPSEPGTLLDLGSGTGYFTPLLRSRFPGSTLISLDLAHGMLEYARRHRPGEGTAWVCGDAEQLPLASGSLDLVFSSLAIQWCEQPDRLFAEIARVLRPGALRRRHPGTRDIAGAAPLLGGRRRPHTRQPLPALGSVAYGDAAGAGCQRLPGRNLGAGISRVAPADPQSQGDRRPQHESGAADRADRARTHAGVPRRLRGATQRRRPAAGDLRSVLPRYRKAVGWVQRCIFTDVNGLHAV